MPSSADRLDLHPLPERALSDVALVLLQVADLSALNDAIESALRMGAEALQADRGILFEFSPDTSYGDAVREWCGPTCSSPVLGGRYRASEAPETFDAMRNGESLPLIPNGPSKRCRPLLRILANQGSVAVVMTPIRNGAALRWAQVFEWRHQTPDLTPEVIAYCRHFADILHAGLNRQKELQVQADTQVKMMERQKLESLGVMAGGIAHDFNNVLQGVLGMSEMLMLDLPEGRAHQWAKSIMDVATRGAHLTSRLLSFSRQDVRQRRNVNVAEKIADVVQMLRRSIPEDRNLQVHIEEEVGQVHIAPTDFEQALINLCNNASGAMPTGGTIRIAARQFEDPTGQTGGWVEVSVTDEGVGMTPEVLARACDAFYTTKPPGEGTGLGLAMVRRTTDAAGGALELRSSPGAGTTATIRLPSSQGGTPVTDFPVGPPITGTETLLLVEDDPFIRRVAATHLERAGFTVLRAEDGEEALTLFRDHHESIALVITDAVMPKLSGRSLFEALEAQSTAPPPFLFVSGYEAGSLSKDFLDGPGRDFLEKPYEARQLLARARRLIDQRSSDPLSDLLRR